jgi:hypothetical protein
MAITETAAAYEAGSANSDAITTSGEPDLKVVPFPPRTDAPEGEAPDLNANTDDTFDITVQHGEAVPRAQSQRNIVIALNRLGVQPTYDTFTKQTNLVIKDRKRRRQHTEPLTDSNELELWLLLDRTFRFLPSRELRYHERHRVPEG